MATLKITLHERGQLVYDVSQSEAEKFKEAFENVKAKSYIIEQDEIPADYISKVEIE